LYTAQIIQTYIKITKSTPKHYPKNTDYIPRKHRFFTAKLPQPRGVEELTYWRDSHVSACSQPITHITLVGSTVIAQKRAPTRLQPDRRSLTTEYHLR